MSIITNEYDMDLPLKSRSCFEVDMAAAALRTVSAVNETSLDIQAVWSGPNVDGSNSRRDSSVPDGHKLVSVAEVAFSIPTSQQSFTMSSRVGRFALEDW